jgi:hypothetical protein
MLFQNPHAAWRYGPTACAVALLIPGALGAAPTLAIPAAPTAREIVERQLAAPPIHREPISGEEASRIRDVYMSRIGKKLEPQQDLPGSRAGS